MSALANSGCPRARALSSSRACHGDLRVRRNRPPEHSDDKETSDLHPASGGNMRKVSVLLLLCFLLLLGSAVQGQSTSGVNDAELNGNYAFSFSGIHGNASVASTYAAVGRFTADGAGNITNGELDTNGVGIGTFVAQAFTGTYSIGADHRGVMTFTGPGGSLRFAFAMLANGNAHLIEFDASGGAGTRSSPAISKTLSRARNTAGSTVKATFGAARVDTATNRL